MDGLVWLFKQQDQPRKDKQMSRKRVSGISILMLVVVAGVGFMSGCAEQSQATETAIPPTVDVDTISVDTGVSWVTAEGMVTPLREAPMSVPLPGKIAEIVVAEGDRVSEGDPLLRLESGSQEAALLQAQAGLSLAEANLESAQAELVAAQSEQALAMLGVEAADDDLAYLEAGATAEEIAVGESMVKAAEAGVSAAAGNQALVTEGPRQSQILAAKSQLLQAQAAEKQAQDAVNQASGEEKARLEDELMAAVSNVRAAQAALDELQSGASQSERLAAGLAVTQAIDQRDEAQAQLELLRSGPRDEALEVARVALQQAEGRASRAEKAVVQAERAVVRAEAGVEQAKAAVAAAQVVLDQMTLRAPFDGAVAAIAYRPGEVALPGVTAVQIADFGGWLVETTDLSELDVVALAVGFPAEIRLDALPGETLTGKVIKISPTATVEAGDVRYQVTIQLDDPGDLPLRWGMTALVDIEVEQ